MNYIMQMRPRFGIEERNAINDYMLTDPFITEFKKTKEFEEKIKDYTRCRECVVVNNGTISMTLAAIALGYKEGDEVIVPNYTMIATPNSFKMIGVKPVFVDIDKNTLCIDLDLAEKAINKNTKAIVLVSANGRYPNQGIKNFEKLCARYNIDLIEDAAQSLGSKYPDGRHIGTAGIIGSISFSAPKIISTGQGGAIITNNTDIANKIKRLKDFGRNSGGNDIHDYIGFNFKFTDLQACIGIEQFKKLDWRVDRKKEIYKLYKENLNIPQIHFFDQDIKNTTPWFIDVIAEKRDELIKYLHECKIGTRQMYPPINKQKSYNLKQEHPNSNYIGKFGLWLPSDSHLTDEEVYYVCKQVKEFYSEK